MTLRFPPLLLGPTTKGFWSPTPVTRSDFVAAGHTLTDGSLTWPVLTLDADAVVHNIAQLAAFTAERGLAFAPHGKTTMSPELFAAQLDAGAWGITVATGNQLLAAHSFGVRRVLVANEVLDPTVLRWIAATLAAEPSTEILFHVDSVEAVDARGCGRDGGRSGCCSRSGHAAGRSGVRTGDQALAVARARGADPGRRAGRGQRLRGCARRRRRRAERSWPRCAPSRRCSSARGCCATTWCSPPAGPPTSTWSPTSWADPTWAGCPARRSCGRAPTSRTTTAPTRARRRSPGSPGTSTRRCGSGRRWSRRRRRARDRRRRQAGRAVRLRPAGGPAPAPGR